MLYLSIDKSRIKLLYLKKTMLGQYESAFYEKTHQIELAKDGEIQSTDLFASAIREAITVINPVAVKEKDIQLVLPQESFAFMRAEVPVDIANSAIAAFIRDKARAQLSIDLENSLYDYVIQENEKGKQVLFFALKKEVYSKYYDALTLLNLQITNIIPDTLAYFKLFEKTLRKDKKEYIMYSSYEKGEVKAYVYDSYGPLEDKRLHHAVTTKTIEHFLKEKGDEYEAQGKKMNRLILSGEDSDSIRQDTFTKDVGIWTNPLKRIIPQFYEDYLKILVTSPNQPLPFLTYDVCIGAFIFSLENKQFSFFKKGSIAMGNERRKFSIPFPSKLPIKEIIIFVVSFILSFITLLVGTNIWNNNKTVNPEGTKTEVTQIVSPSPETPTATPTPAISRKDIKVKILNGSGAKGKASEIKELLKGKGYEDILTGNADNFDYATTEIQVKKGKDEIATMMKSDIKDSSSSPKVTELEADAAADVVLIFGADFK